jgi:ElaB/YqjD/DUF883 family membrane-anchored ribosome-binding protein
MELYFKELISKEKSLDALVDDLARLVQGADNLAQSIGVNLAESPRTEMARRLRRLKDRCERINEEVVARAQATDRTVRKYPYAFLGIALLLGLLAGAWCVGREE